MASDDDDVQLRMLSPRPTDTIEPSPARDALRGNLRAAESDTGLKKRKSWFGSMRDVFHKSALQAKAAVDSMRGDGKQEGERSPMIEQNSGPRLSTESTSKCSPYHSSITPELRDSLDSVTPTTPLKSHTFSPQLNRRRTFSPREAVSSLRQHIHGHGTRNKRASVYTIIGRTSSEIPPDIAGPEQFTSPQGRGSDDLERHARKNSVASSLVGSIRGLALRSTKGKGSAPSEPHSAPIDPAEEVPPPSSPINIPTAAPVLGLDLGIPGMNFLPTEMPGVSDNVRDPDTVKLQDPANFGIPGVVGRNSSLPFVPDQIKKQYTHPAVRQRPTMPSEMLQPLPVERRSPTPSPPPATPMPGTNLSLELDGASDSASSGKKTQVFERSVTPETRKDRKELRSMCSLDAIADAGTTARKDSAVEACETVREERQHALSVQPTAPPNSNPFSPRGSIPSPSTASECPSDMPPLERQVSGDSKFYRFGVGTKPSRDWSTVPILVEDPFDDGNISTERLPSPVKSVKLPVRLKIKGPSDESVASVELPSSPTPARDQDVSPGAHYTFQTPPKYYMPPEDDIDANRHLQRNYAVSQNLASIEQRPTPPCSREQAEILSDDTMTRAQSLFNSDVVYPGYDEYPLDSEGASEIGISPHGGPMVPAPLNCLDSSPTSAPGKSTWKAGLGLDGFRFSIDTWRPPGTQPLPEPQPQQTPSRRRTELSIDSVSVDETFETPIGSRASTKSGRTPDMGNKMELDARRSERNMRYNALQQEQMQHDGAKQRSSLPIRMHARFNISDVDPIEARYFPQYSTAFTASRDAGHKEERGPTRFNSEDSMTLSLRSASDNMEKLRALLDNIDSDHEKPVKENEEEVIVDAFTTASSPSKHPIGRKNHGIRSVSPSPQTSPAHKLPGAPTMRPTRSSNSTVLDLEINIVSSPASDSTTIADLPTTATRHQKERVGSGDTLDQTLDMLSSPDSGYKADNSSDVHSPAEKQIPRRYRSQSARKGRKVLGEIAGNRI